MEENNDLTASERTVAAIVSCLARRGVARRDLSIDHLNLDENDEPSLFVNAVQWLEAEGIISSLEEHKFLLSGTEALGYTLTSLGYRLLDRQFEGQLTLGAAIKEVSEGRRSYASAGDFFGGLLGGFTKSISN